MKTQVLTCLLKKVKATVTSEEFRQIEDIILNVALLSPDPKVKAAAKVTRLVLNAKHQK
jgi:hypothetical protein